MDKFFKNTQGTLHSHSPIFCSVSLRKTSHILNRWDHTIDCKIDGFGAMALKTGFVKKPD